VGGEVGGSTRWASSRTRFRSQSLGEGLRGGALLDHVPASSWPGGSRRYWTAPPRGAGPRSGRGAGRGGDCVQRGAVESALISTRAPGRLAAGRAPDWVGPRGALHTLGGANEKTRPGSRGGVIGHMRTWGGWRRWTRVPRVGGRERGRAGAGLSR
jgi:hypothetical protein